MFYDERRSISPIFFLIDRAAAAAAEKRKRNENGEFQIFHDRWRRRDKAHERNMNLFPIPKNGQQISAPLHHLVFLGGEGLPRFFCGFGYLLIEGFLPWAGGHILKKHPVNEESPSTFFREWRKPAKQKPIIKRCNPSRFELDSSWPLVIFKGNRSRIPPLRQRSIPFYDPSSSFPFPLRRFERSEGRGGGSVVSGHRRKETHLCVYGWGNGVLFLYRWKNKAIPFYSFPFDFFIDLSPCGQLSEWATNQQGIS